MVINTNIEAQISADNLRTTQARLSKSLARLSSGCKIVSPADDPAGLAVATGFDDQVQRTEAACNNVMNALSFLQTQDGYLQGVTKAYNRMAELALLAQDPTKTDDDRAAFDADFQQLVHYAADTGSKQFNGQPLFSVNPRTTVIDPDGGTLTMNGIPMNVNDPGTSYEKNVVIGNHDLRTVADAAHVFREINLAIESFASDRAMIGAYETRLNHAADELTVSKQNLTAASSRIQDVDVAEESTEYAKENILVQSGTAMLAQANQMPQAVLKLLQ